MLQLNSIKEQSYNQKMKNKKSKVETKKTKLTQQQKRCKNKTKQKNFWMKKVTLFS